MIRSMDRLRIVMLVTALVVVTYGCGGGGGGSGGSGPAPGPTVGSTSTSTTTTSVARATTTSSSTTTTTIGDSAVSYDVTFSLEDAITLGSIQIEIGYADAGGAFVGSDASVSCTSPLSAAGALVAFGDDDSTRTLNIAALALAGFSGPTTMARCEFHTTGAAPTSDDFAVTVVEANAIDTTPVTPLPGISVSNIVAK